MVGRGGRSKGCFNCRRKKKGCDLKRPFCTQCLHSNTPCEGYDQSMTFIAITQDAAGSSKSSSPPRVTALAARKDLRKFQRPVADIALPGSLARSALQEKTLGLFFELFPYKPPNHAPYSGIVPTEDWVDVARARYCRDDALKLALLALSAMKIGRDHGDQTVVEQGLRVYGKALLEVNKGIQDMERVKGDEMLCACFILGQFEMIAAITSRKTSFLGQPAWKEIPWTNHPKSLKDELLDIMLDIPSILELDDFLRDLVSSHETTRGWSTLLMQCLSINDSLQSWRRRLTHHLHAQQNHSHPGFVETGDQEGSPPPLNDGSPEDDIFSPENVLSHGLPAGILKMYFWTTLVLVYTTYHRAVANSKVPPGWHGHRGTPTTSLPSPRIPALNILRSLPSFFSPTLGPFASQTITFPLGMALQYFSAAASSSPSGAPIPEYRALTSAFKERDDGGLMAGFLSSLQVDATSHRWRKREGIREKSICSDELVELEDEGEKTNGCDEKIGVGYGHEETRERAKTWWGGRPGGESDEVA
ncbi:hypothetical protein K402DRAFT_455606 [Aulographum hederae CBS 113979]|uniref:Zn(2)-C6 fungal-type domain-containing protein n=1 Tax=Aulographum hederae CBS 113979 TaxID=1176131 RepID=A0A6G1GUW8_9PEZI|nr:hypothetical protein K402DRAFT_455606 [Aulographum hederae CBS 113979]